MGINTHGEDVDANGGVSPILMRDSEIQGVFSNVKAS
jgi:hypothetical protein